MKILKTSLSAIPLLALLTAPLPGQVPSPDSPAPAPPPAGAKSEAGLMPPRVEKVTFLGIETRPADPALTAQLGLPDQFGLLVMTVVPDSPAAGVLEKYDLLLKFGDQRLVDPHQLAVLVRAQKPGDAIGLTIVRKGARQTIEVKLAEHEVPRRVAKLRWMAAPDEGTISHEFMGAPFPREDAEDMFGLLQHDRNPANTRIIVREEGLTPHAAVINLGHSTIVYRDDHGTLELTMDSGKKQLVAKDNTGQVLFSGPVNTEDERKAVPPEVMARLKLIETPGNFGDRQAPAALRPHERRGGEPMTSLAPDARLVSPPADEESAHPI